MDIYMFVLHVPKYFAFFYGSDSLLGGRIGPMAKEGVFFV